MMQNRRQRWLLMTLIVACFGLTTRTSESVFSTTEFERHVRYLASEELEGRGVGTAGLDAAAEYIAHYFKEAGVEPGGDNGGYFQSFEVSVSSRIADNTRMVFGSRETRGRVRLRTHEDFIPFPFSKQGGFDGPVVFAGYGIEDDERGYNDYNDVDVRGKVVLVLRYEPAWWADEPVDEQAVERPAGRQTRHAYFMTKAERAAARGAKAMLIVNPIPAEDDETDRLYDFATGRAPAAGLPMLHVKRAAADRMLAAAGLPSMKELQEKIEQTRKPSSHALSGVSVNGFVDLTRIRTPVKNVIGVIRGRGPLAEEYVVLGAHYDHLGVTSDRRKPNDPQRYIHYGADDNASGTAGLLMLARALADGPPLKRSILLFAFTAEESGLLGSKHWVEHPTVPLERVVAMLNMDMIGRLKDDVLTIGGMSTAAGFDELVGKGAEAWGFDLRSGGGGRGPSDHAPFYGKNIPILFFFTGLHREYHSPDDVPDLLNYEGATRVISLVRDCAVAIANAPPRPVFQRDDTFTRPRRQDEAVATSESPHAPAGETEQPAMPRVRLGVAPGNYGDAEDRSGFPIDYVVEGGPAQRAGIKDGDRILKIGGREINDIYSYMYALSENKPGDEIEVVVARGAEEMKFTVKLEAAQRGPARE
jgi:hypothetical protein